MEEDHPHAATGNTRAWESEWMGEDREPVKISGSVTLKILPLLLAEEQPTISVNEEGEAVCVVTRSILNIFFGIRVVVLREFVLQDQVVNG